VLTRRRSSTSGRLPSLGHDFDRGHREYVERLSKGQQLWLRTKPFSAPPNYELGECLHTFAHIVRELGLGLRAQVLDVGCGPGWLSELLARCGYWVTGVDISEDMVAIARERIAAIPVEVGPGVGALAEFHAMPVREMPWSDRFDAAILYDTMHHFDDELETLKVICRTLVPGGRIYIREGVKPPPGSEAERNLIEEMRERETLESPFDPDYLVDVVEQAGFEDVRRLLVLDEVVDVADLRQPLRHLARFWSYRRSKGEMNTILARKPFGEHPADAMSFSARIEQAGPLEESHEPGWLLLPVEVTNTGSAFWPNGAGFPFPPGVVNLGPYVLHESGERRELQRALLPHGVSSGGSARVTVRARREAVAGRQLHVDLVREGVLWFSELGTQPLVVRVEG
jgi:SAM-dependent methyltransferase